MPVHPAWSLHSNAWLKAATALRLVGTCLGLRWQAQRDTAFARTEVFRNTSRQCSPESAVAAPALPAHSMTRSFDPRIPTIFKSISPGFPPSHLLRRDECGPRRQAIRAGWAPAPTPGNRSPNSSTRQNGRSGCSAESRHLDLPVESGFLPKADTRNRLPQLLRSCFPFARSPGVRACARLTLG